MNREQFESHPAILWTEAIAKGAAAAAACHPTPMVVQQHENLLDDSSAVAHEWVVPGGPCGFVWVNIRPATQKFARWAKKQQIGRIDSHYGGLTIWCPLPTQSMELKEAWCDAVAAHLRTAGVNAYMQSRMD